MIDLNITEAFADTGYWIALLNRRDAAVHRKAQEVSQQITAGHIQVVTSEMVLTEFLNFFSKFGPLFRKQAAEVVSQLQKQADVTIIEQNSEQFQEALTLYAQYQDKAWGHTDCVSFILMRRRGITHALAYDEHFKQAGFIALLRDA